MRWHESRLIFYAQYSLRSAHFGRILHSMGDDLLYRSLVWHHDVDAFRIFHELQFLFECSVRGFWRIVRNHGWHHSFNEWIRCGHSRAHDENGQVQYKNHQVSGAQDRIQVIYEPFTVHFHWKPHTKAFRATERFGMWNHFLCYYLRSCLCFDINLSTGHGKAHRTHFVMKIAEFRRFLIVLFAVGFATH